MTKKKEKCDGFLFGVAIVVGIMALGFWMIDKADKHAEQAPVCQLIDKTEYGIDGKTGFKVEKRRYALCENFIPNQK